MQNITIFIFYFSLVSAVTIQLSSPVCNQLADQCSIKVNGSVDDSSVYFYDRDVFAGSISSASYAYVEYDLEYIDTKRLYQNMTTTDVYVYYSRWIGRATISPICDVTKNSDSNNYTYIHNCDDYNTKKSYVNSLIYRRITGVLPVAPIPDYTCEMGGDSEGSYCHYTSPTWYLVEYYNYALYSIVNRTVSTNMYLTSSNSAYQNSVSDMGKFLSNIFITPKLYSLQLPSLDVNACLLMEYGKRPRFMPVCNANDPYYIFNYDNNYSYLPSALSSGILRLEGKKIKYVDSRSYIIPFSYSGVLNYTKVNSLQYSVVSCVYDSATSVNCVYSAILHNCVITSEYSDVTTFSGISTTLRIEPPRYFNASIITQCPNSTPKVYSLFGERKPKVPTTINNTTLQIGSSPISGVVDIVTYIAVGCSIGGLLLVLLLSYICVRMRQPLSVDLMKEQ